MKKISFIVALLILTSCSRYDQISQKVRFDGEKYTIHTYSNGLFNIPKQYLDLSVTTTNPKEVKTIKKREWDKAKKFVDNQNSKS